MGAAPDMNSTNTEIIFGPPGTGKTTDLMRIIEEKIRSGVPSREICCISFTRKAAYEVKTRMMKKFSLAEEDLPWFRTLHSMAFITLGYTKNQMMGKSDYFSIAEQLGIYITLRGINEDGTLVGLSKGDRLLFMENMARTKDISLREYWESQPDEDIDWYELERLAHTLVKYKEANDRQDFTDVIHAFNRNPRVPECQVLIVDEAQDLSPIQWKMVRHIGNYAEHIYIAGDDDQAIFRWAGAESEILLGLEGTRRVLPQSYRIPPAVQLLANRVVQRITRRVGKSWKPRENAEGTGVEFVQDIGSVDLGTGTWLLLARNSYLLGAYEEYCLSQGFVFTSTVGSPFNGDSLHAIRTWESLRRGNACDAADVKRVYSYMSPKVSVAYGAKTNLERIADSHPLTINELRRSFGLLTTELWHVALDKLNPTEVTYFLTALKRGEKLSREPRIRISTIHSVKGGEADNVVLQTDMAPRTYKEYEENPDDEHRVWYVAVTRAKNKLFIIEPKTNKCYDL